MEQLLSTGHVSHTVKGCNLNFLRSCSHERRSCTGLRPQQASARLSNPCDGTHTFPLTMWSHGYLYIPTPFYSFHGTWVQLQTHISHQRLTTDAHLPPTSYYRHTSPTNVLLQTHISHQRLTKDTHLPPTSYYRHTSPTNVLLQTHISHQRLSTDTHLSPMSYYRHTSPTNVLLQTHISHQCLTTDTHLPPMSY